MNIELRSVFIYGRFKDLSRQRINQILVNRGGRRVRSGLRADIVVLAHSALGRCVVGDHLALPFATSPTTVLMSESTFRRALMSSPAEPSPGPYAIGDVARLSGLPEPACTALALFDVFASSGSRFTYQDIATAKQVARLLQDGVDFRSIISAGLLLGRRGLRMAQTRLATAPWGEIVQSVGDRIVQLNGQFALVLDEKEASADQIFARASEREADGDSDEAVRLYSLAEKLDRHDPAIPFNRGNALVALGRPAEAMIAFQQARDRDPHFAEAAFNLAHLYEAERRVSDAERFYRLALEVHPGYAAALYNLARILTEKQSFGAAAALWERFLVAAPDDRDADRAGKLLALCRMERRLGQDR